MKEGKINVKTLTRGAAVAALYVVLTWLSDVFGLAGENVVQLRLSEALTVLPAFTGAAVPGLTVGCLISNILFTGSPWDIIFGTLATLLGALGTYKLCRTKFSSPIPPILANTLIIPFVLRFAYQIPNSVPYLMLTVGIGEILSCGVLGVILYSVLEKQKDRFFG